MAKYISTHSGKEIDDAVDQVYKQELLGGSAQIIESDLEDPTNLDDLTEKEGKFVVEHYETEDGEASDGPIEIEIFKDEEGNTIQRTEENGIVKERIYNPETEDWTDWIPVVDNIQVEGNAEVQVTKDTVVFRKISGADDPMLKDSDE